MNNLREYLADRVQNDPTPFTLRVRLSSSRKTAEYALAHVLEDGFIGQVVNRQRTTPEWVRYGALDRVRILEQGDI